MKTFKKLVIFSVMLIFGLQSSQAQIKLYAAIKEGGLGNGTLIEYNPSSNSITKLCPLPSVYQGRFPMGTFTIIGSTLYSTAGWGGPNYNPNGSNGGYGSIFKWNRATNTYVPLAYFGGGNNGSLPVGTMILVNGKLYGMTKDGGNENKGLIYEFNPTTNVITPKASFNGSNGAHPTGSLIYVNSKFYGLTSEGGASDAGVIFEYNLATNQIVSKVSMTLAKGCEPHGSFILKSNKLYATTELGGANLNGAIIEYTPGNTDYTTKVSFTDNVNGRFPYCDLTLYNNIFYGSTQYDNGTNGHGYLFKWDPNGTNVITLHHMDYSVGGDLTVYNGKIYGMAQGNSYNEGYAFSYNLSTNVFQNLFDFDYTNGRLPSVHNKFIVQTWAIEEKPSGIDPNSSQIEINNPKIYFANQNINIVNNWDKSAMVTVYDINGREVASYQANQGSNNFSFGFQKGVYIVKMANENQVYKTKIINM